MQEVTVESLEKLEMKEGLVRLSANAGPLSIVCSQEVWEDLPANAPTFAEPTLRVPLQGDNLCRS